MDTDAAAHGGNDQPAIAPLIRHSRKRRQTTPTPATQTHASLSAGELDAEGRPDKCLKGDDAATAFAAASIAPSPAAVAAHDPFAFDPSRDDATGAVRRAPTASRFAGLSDGMEVDTDQGDADRNAKDAQTIDNSCRIPRTFLIHSDAYGQLLDLQSIHCGRMRYYSSLMHSLQAARWPGLSILPPRRATAFEMELFHSRSYLAAMRAIASKFERHATGEVELVRPLSASEKEAQQLYGLIDDCPVFAELFDLVQFTIGGTMRAVDCLMSAHAARPLAPVIACHWGGGRHHGESDCAKGFCYCNDAVCACLRLLSSPAYPRVLYLDVDLHHGDGVEQAFIGSPSVLTCSFHHHAPGFFPGTGDFDTLGNGDAKHSALNIPLREGIDDATYCLLFDGVLSLLLPSFRPSVVVVCCGVDGLASDRMSPFNLTTRAFARIVQLLKKRLGHFVTPTAPEATAAPAAMDGERDAVLPSQESLSAPATNAPHDGHSAAAAAAQPVNQSDELTVEQHNDSDAVVDPPTSAAPCEESSAASDVCAATAAPAQSAATDPPTTSSALSPSWPSSPIPLLLLGGGGYCPTDSARAFVHMTAAACAHSLPAALPDSDPHYPHYLPNLSMHSLAKPTATRPNANDRSYLRRLLTQVRDNCIKRRQMQTIGDDEETLV